MNRTLALLGVAAALVLALTGCRAQTDGGDVEEPGLSAPLSASVVDESGAPVPKTTPGPLDPAAGSSAVDVNGSTPVPLRRNLALAAQVDGVTGDPIVVDTSTSTAPVHEDYYANCAEVRAAGMAPIARGDHGYRDALDRDQDGFACDVSEDSPTSSSTTKPPPSTVDEANEEEPDVTNPQPTRPRNPDEEQHTTDPDGTQRLVGADPGEGGPQADPVDDSDDE